MQRTIVRCHSWCQQRILRPDGKPRRKGSMVAVMHRVKFPYTFRTIPSLLCMPRCRKNGNMLLYPRRLFHHIPCQVTAVSISPIDGIGILSTRATFRGAVVAHTQSCDVCNANVRTRVDICGCAMRDMNQGRKVALFSSGPNLMTMVNLSGKSSPRKAELPRCATSSKKTTNNEQAERLAVLRVV